MNLMKPLSYFLIFFFVISVGLTAGTQNEKITIGDHEFYVSKEELRHEIPGDSHLTVLGFTIGKNSLKEIQVSLGPAKILQESEHGPSQICYQSTQERDGTSLIFEAGPLGGWQTLTSFVIESNSESIESNRCHQAHLVSKRIHTKSGIRLGLTQKQLRVILGAPTKIIKNNWFYLYQSQRKMTQEEIERLAIKWPIVRQQPYFDVNSFIQVTYSNSKITKIMIGKVESF